MNVIHGCALGAVCVLLGAGCTDNELVREPIRGDEMPAGTTAWEEVTRDWPESSKSAAREMVEKYGRPDELTSSMLVWGPRGQWKRSIVSREEVRHGWPSDHVDVLEQFIDYRIPSDKADELTAFDGSVMVERTKGELSARCGGEAANFLAVNLARDIIEGDRSVEDARGFYERAMREHKAGNTPDYMKELRFDPPRGGTGDLDQAALASR